MNKETKNRKDIISTAHSALNRGTTELAWREDFCECDQSVGMVPCEYCAMYNVILLAKRQQSEIEQLQKWKSTVESQALRSCNCGVIKDAMVRLQRWDEAAIWRRYETNREFREQALENLLKDEE